MAASKRLPSSSLDRGGRVAAHPGNPLLRRFVRRSAAWSTELSLPGTYGWGAVAAALVFIAVTCWWLTQDRSIPIYDAGDHLESAFQFHSMIQSGDLLGPFNRISQYPPLALLVGALAVFVGGVNVASPIVGENLVFVPLLVLGCYQTGKLLFDERAGLLAAIFALGSPLLAEQFHVFMLDVPEASVVAVSIWLLLASENFARARMAFWAGLAVGCGVVIKVTFPIFVAGIVLVLVVRGGWRNRRGLVGFAAPALVVGAPWYVDHLSELGTITQLAGNSSGAAPGNLPPLLSTANLLWYFWSTLNSQLFAPLFLLVVVGAAMTVRATLRRDLGWDLRLAFLVGGFAAWLGVTLTPHHDIRYDIPLMPYLAVVATGWIVFLPRIARIAVVTFTALAVAANTLGSTFGVGGPTELKLVASPPATQALPDRIIVHSNVGFLVDRPRRDGDVASLLAALRRHGVSTVALPLTQTVQPDFSFEGLLPLARIAKLKPAITNGVQVSGEPTVATLVHHSRARGEPPVCATLSDGTGVWVVREDPTAGKLGLYCPRRQPSYYYVGRIG